MPSAADPRDPLLPPPLQLRIPGATSTQSAVRALDAAVKARVQPCIRRTVLEALVSCSVSHTGQADLCSISAVSLSTLGASVRAAAQPGQNYKLSDVLGQLRQYTERLGPGGQLVRLKAAELLEALPPPPAPAATSHGAAPAPLVGASGCSAGSSAGGSRRGSSGGGGRGAGGAAVFLPSTVAQATARPDLWGEIPLGPLVLDQLSVGPLPGPLSTDPAAMRHILASATRQRRFPGLPRGKAALCRAALLAVLAASELSPRGGGGGTGSAAGFPAQVELRACYCQDAQRALERLLDTVGPLDFDSESDTPSDSDESDSGRELPAGNLQLAHKEYFDHWRDMVWFRSRVPELQDLLEYAKVPNAAYTWMGKYLLRADRLLGVACSLPSPPAPPQLAAPFRLASGAAVAVPEAKIVEAAEEEGEEEVPLALSNGQVQVGAGGAAGGSAGGQQGPPVPQQPQWQQQQSHLQLQGEECASEAASGAVLVAASGSAGGIPAVELMRRLQAARRVEAARAAGMEAQLVGAFLAAHTVRQGAGTEGGAVLEALLEAQDWEAACAYMRVAVKIAGA